MFQLTWSDSIGTFAGHIPVERYRKGKKTNSCPCIGTPNVFVNLEGLNWRHFKQMQTYSSRNNDMHVHTKLLLQRKGTCLQSCTDPGGDRVRGWSRNKKANSK